MADQSKQKTLTGVVVSTKMKDTAVVEVSRYVKHPKYQKFMRREKRYLAHDPGNSAKEGDKVVIRSCRPISRHKHFMLVAEKMPNKRGKDAETHSVSSA